MIRFIVIPSNGSLPSNAVNTVFLRIDHWNDYSFVTMFDVFAFDEQGVKHELANVKIGFSGQTEAVSTYSKLTEPFLQLPEGYFSLGMDVSYYAKLRNEFSETYRTAFLIGLRDVVLNKQILSVAIEEQVFRTSHLRNFTLNTIENQFQRVLDGGVLITDYDFRFTLYSGEKRAGYQLPFKVVAHSKPRTNIHALIGRNGVGKTSLLNAMIRSVTTGASDEGLFELSNGWGEFTPIGTSYFSGIVSISFSAFDPFNPPEEQTDPTKGACYYYVGLKNYADQDGALLIPTCID